jgi:cytochrome P450
VRERIQHEVDAVYADGVPDAARFRHAATLARAVKEAMRLYPVAPFLPKVAATEFEFGGYRVPKGTDVYQFHTRSHFEAEHYENPWEFDIDRPTPKAAAYAPFGVGPHTCIGAGMGELQVICNVAALMHHGAWEVVPKGYTVTRNVLPMSPRGFRLRLVGRRTEEAK